jgi:hypothetical protein
MDGDLMICWSLVSALKGFYTHRLGEKNQINRNISTGTVKNNPSQSHMTKNNPNAKRSNFTSV